MKREVRRRNALEPEIGHQKADGILGRCQIKGIRGDATHAILCGVGTDLPKILARLLLCMYARLRVWLLDHRPIVSLMRLVPRRVPHAAWGPPGLYGPIRIDGRARTAGTHFPGTTILGSRAKSSNCATPLSGSKELWFHLTIVYDIIVSFCSNSHADSREPVGGFAL